MLLVPLLLVVLRPTPASAQISIGVSVNVAPPELPVYDQPPIPGDGYVWTPGYWAWSDDDQDYFWVPGTWVPAPQPDYLWTPGYWGAADAVFLWHPGYWGPHIGFYGGVNYGYGYGGEGYQGGYWQGGHLFYNRSVNNISNTNITNVYNKTVINNVTINRVSYNGGNGVQARPTEAQMAVGREHHIEATPLQQQHVSMARSDPSLRLSSNRGHPAIAATARPAAFHGAGVVPARNAGPLNEAHPNAAPQSRENNPRENIPQRGGEPAAHPAAPRAGIQARPEAQQRAEPQSRPEAQPRAAPPPRPEAQSRPEIERRAPQPEPPHASAAPAPHPSAPPAARPAAPQHPERSEREPHEHP
jgi:hypothetical protein